MNEKPWTFEPYNREVWNKSNTRVMFVGADPNDNNPKINKKTGREVRDMGEWFKQAPKNDYFNNLKFYNRIKIMLEGVLPNEDRPFDHMRYVDFKASPGVSKAKTEDVMNYVRGNHKIVSKYFQGEDRPNIVILTGGHAKIVYFKSKKENLIDYDGATKFVCLPHPRFRGSNDNLISASTEILDRLMPASSNKLWKWSPKKNEWALLTK